MKKHAVTGRKLLNDRSIPIQETHRPCLDESNRLFQVIQAFKTVDFHPDRMPDLAMGYIFEDLVRRSNEQANEEAGDHFTPREVISLMVHILYTYDEKIYDPGRVVSIYDPTVGTGGMLSVSEKYILEHNTKANLELFGQEYNPESYAICGSPLFTGDAAGGESNIRRWIIENDMLEAVIGLPDQLFYNTGIFT
jgi:type I restriction-modification system DNA methylase subunit